MAVNDIAKVRIVTTFGVQMGMVVTFWKSTAVAGTGSNLAGLATAVDTVWAPLFKAVMASTATYRGVGAQRVFPLPPTVESTTIANLGVGGVAGDVLPSQICGLISKGTASAGRAFRGRSYIPFPGEASNDPTAVPSAAYLAAMATLAASMTAPKIAGGGGNTETWAPQVYHRGALTATLITSAVVRSQWATQRRRGGFGATNVAPF